MIQVKTFAFWEDFECLSVFRSAFTGSSRDFLVAGYSWSNILFWWFIDTMIIQYWHKCWRLWRQVLLPMTTKKAKQTKEVKRTLRCRALQTHPSVKFYFETEQVPDLRIHPSDEFTITHPDRFLTTEAKVITFFTLISIVTCYSYPRAHLSNRPDVGN